MIVHDRRFLDDTPIATDGRAPRPSMAILQAAMEIRREGREWLDERLGLDRDVHADAQTEALDEVHSELRGEISRLQHALQSRESAISALGEQAAAAARLNSQLARQMSSLWEEREQLLAFLETAASERSQLTETLNEVRTTADLASHSIEELVRERDTLTAELALHHAAAVAGAAIEAPEPAILPADVTELGRAIELMSDTLGEIRRFALEARGAGPALLAAASDSTTRLAALPDLQAEVGRLGARMDTLVGGLTDLLESSRAPWTRAQTPRLARVSSPSSITHSDFQAPSLMIPHGGRVRPLLTLQAVERALARALPSIGLPRHIITPLLSAWLAGAAPVVSGRGALTALQVCGRVLAADRLVTVPVDASVSYPEQLLVGPANSDNHPADGQSPLLNLLLDAHSAAGAERLALVVFEGANRAAVERSLLPLLQLILQRDDAAHRTLDDVLPEGLPEDGPYSALLGRPWPSNVLVAVTVADGNAEAIQPLPSAFWTRAAYLCLDHLPAGAESGAGAAPSTAGQRALQQRMSFVPSELWESWTAETRDEAEMTACTSGDIDVLDSRRDVVATWRMIEAALAVIGRRHPAERTASVLLHHAVVPWAVSAGLEREAAQLVQSQSAPSILGSDAAPRPCCACLARAIRGDSTHASAV